MIINVNKISEKGVSFNDIVDIDPNQLIEEESYFAEGVNYQILFRRENNRIRAQGKIRTTISVVCVRCLEHFDFKINSRFDVLLFPIKMMEQKSSALNPDDLEYIFYEEDQIDINKILVEQVNLFLPNNPACSPRCKGICPNCGTNLNHETCKCEPPQNEIKFVFGKSKR